MAGVGVLLTRVGDLARGLPGVPAIGRAGKERGASAMGKVNPLKNNVAISVSVGSAVVEHLSSNKLALLTRSIVTGSVQVRPPSVDLLTRMALATENPTLAR